MNRHLAGILLFLLVIATFAVALDSKSVIRAQSVVEKGQKLLEKQSFKKAEAKFREAITIEPELPESYLGLASALLGQQDYPAALEQVIEARSRYEAWHARELELDITFERAIPEDAGDPYKAVVTEWHPRLWWDFETHEDYDVEVRAPQEYAVACTGRLDTDSGSRTVNPSAISRRTSSDVASAPASKPSVSITPDSWGRAWAA